MNGMNRQQELVGGLRARNERNQNEQLDKLLHQYFRFDSAAVSPSNKRRKRPQQPTLEATAIRRHPNGLIATDAAGAPSLASPASPEIVLKQLKRFLKESTDAAHIQRVADTVHNQLTKAKRQRKLLPLAVTLCEELFLRSSVFRGLLATQTSSFFQKCLEAAGEKDVATKRKRKQGTQQSEQVDRVLAMVESWRDNFGARYPTLVAGYAGLVELGYVFPCLRERNAQAQEEEATRRQRQVAVRRAKRKRMESEMAHTEKEMEITIAEMNNIFEILVPTLEAFDVEEEHETVVNGVADAERADQEEDEEEGVATVSAMIQERDQEGDVDDGDEEDEEEDGVDWEDVAEDTTVDVAEHEDEDQQEEEHSYDPGHMDINEIVEAYGLGSSSYQLTISVPTTTLCEKSTDNEALFRNLSDNVLQIRKRFLPLVRDWIQVLDGDAVALGEPREVAVLARLGDLQSRLERATLKWEDLVKESERKKFATVQSRVVALPLAAFDDGAASHPKRQRR